MKTKDASETIVMALSSNEARREYIKAILDDLALVDPEARVAILQGALETLLQALPDLPSDEEIEKAARAVTFESDDYGQSRFIAGARWI